MKRYRNDENSSGNLFYHTIRSVPNKTHLQCLEISQYEDRHQSLLDSLLFSKEYAMKESENNQQFLSIYRYISNAVEDLKPIVHSRKKHSILKAIYIKYISSSTRNGSLEVEILFSIKKYLFCTITLIILDPSEIPCMPDVPSLIDRSYTATLACGTTSLDVYLNSISSSKKATIQKGLLLQIFHQILFFGDVLNLKHGDLHFLNFVVDPNPIDFMLSIQITQQLPYARCEVYFKNFPRVTIIDYGIMDSTVPRIDSNKSLSSSTPADFDRVVLLANEIIKNSKIMQSIKSFGSVPFFTLAHFNTTEDAIGYESITVKSINYTESMINNLEFNTSLQQKNTFNNFSYRSYYTANRLKELGMGPPEEPDDDAGDDAGDDNDSDDNELKLEINVPYDIGSQCDPLLYSDQQKNTNRWPLEFSAELGTRITRKAQNCLKPKDGKLVISQEMLLCFFLKFSSGQSYIIKQLLNPNISSFKVAGSSLFEKLTSKNQSTQLIKARLYQNLCQEISKNTYTFHKSNLAEFFKLVSSFSDSSPKLYSNKQTNSDIFGQVYDDLSGDLYVNYSSGVLGLFCRKLIKPNTAITQYYGKQKICLNETVIPEPIQFFGCGDYANFGPNPNCKIIKASDVIQDTTIMFKTKKPSELLLISTTVINPNTEIIIENK